MSFGAGFPQDGIPDKGWQLFVTSTVFVILAAIFVAIRLAARWTKHTIGADDVTIFLSLLFSIVLTIAMDNSVSNGYGVKKALLTKAQLGKAMKWFYFAQIFYKIVIMLNKTSMILLYLRIFVGTRFRRACFVSLAIVACWSIGSIVSTILQCIPIEASWNTSTQDKVCTNSDAAWYQYGILNILTDAMILALPIFPILKLQLGRREKIGLLFVFLIGAIVCIVSIARVVAVANSAELKKDVTGNFIPRSTLTMVEANVGIICACLPMMQQPLSMFFPRLFRASSSGATKSASTGRSHELRGVSRSNFAYPRVEHEFSVVAGDGDGGKVMDGRRRDASAGSLRSNKEFVDHDSDDELLTAANSRAGTVNGQSKTIKVMKTFAVERT